MTKVYFVAILVLRTTLGSSKHERKQFKVRDEKEKLEEKG